MYIFESFVKSSQVIKLNRMQMLMHLPNPSAQTGFNTKWMF